MTTAVAWLSENLSQRIPGSKHFYWSEALYIEQVGAFAVPTPEQQANIIKQAKALDRIRDYFNRPIVVHSWLRPPKYNALVGGAPASKHITGMATDFHVEGFSCDLVKQVIQSGKLYPGRGELNTTDWVHLDLGGDKWFIG